MKPLTLVLAGLALCGATAGVAAAPQARLALWVTEPVGATNASQCKLAPAPGMPFSLPATAPSLTERDVSDWHPDTARWFLDPARFAGAAAAQELQDHCFVLAIDGKALSSGVMLSSHSARLTDFPTISVATADSAISLQLFSGYQGRPMQPIHVEALDAVLGQRANLQRQLQRIGADGNPLAHDLQGMGNAWIAAVRKLIERNEIHQGMPLADMIKHLGPPTSVTELKEGKAVTRYVWYFTTPMHVNPLFEAYVEDDTVRAYAFGRR